MLIEESTTTEQTKVYLLCIEVSTRRSVDSSFSLLSIDEEFHLSRLKGRPFFDGRRTVELALGALLLLTVWPSRSLWLSLLTDVPVI